MTRFAAVWLCGTLVQHSASIFKLMFTALALVVNRAATVVLGVILYRNFGAGYKGLNVIFDKENNQWEQLQVCVVCPYTRRVFEALTRKRRVVVVFCTFLLLLLLLLLCHLCRRRSQLVLVRMWRWVVPSRSRSLLPRSQKRQRRMPLTSRQLAPLLTKNSTKA